LQSEFGRSFAILFASISKFLFASQSHHESSRPTQPGGVLNANINIITIRSYDQHITPQLHKIKIRLLNIIIIMTSILSPDATAFHPFFEPINVAIYNNGVPSMTLVSEEEVCEILHGIQDEALDESFPPTAAEAAEIEAVADFVRSMAMFAYMEEREENARFTFCHIKKRWEFRRSEGLQGRPRKARHTVEEVKHLPRSTLITTTLVPHTMHRHIDVKNRHQELATRHHKEPRHTKHTAGARRSVPIVMPRKT
jgi:hypothetical protein